MRQAYHTLQGFVSIKPCNAVDCIGRSYNRLNEDYRHLHALCRFFLENSGASHQTGDRSMLSFLIDMDRLYELFVTEWLKENLPPNLLLKCQERVNISKTVYFQPDLVLDNALTGTPVYVLDTKYKTPDSPATEDIAKAIAYAHVKSCAEAVLVYPQPLNKMLDTQEGSIRVRNLTFSLEGNLNQAGKAFSKDLLSVS